MNGVRPPPLLLGAVLLFWGWQTGFLHFGAVMALVIELPRWSKTRWEFSLEDFNRIWTFSTLLLLAGVVYAFTLNEGPSRFSEMFQEPDLRNQSRAGLSGARTAASLVRWLPMVFFLFVAAQLYSSKGGVPLETVSLILRRRWKRARKLGQTPPPSRSIDVSYIYFIICLFSSTIYIERTRLFFWGLAVLIAWALWPLRSRRFSPVTWACSLGAAVAMAWFGHQGISSLQQYVENLNPQWLSSMTRPPFSALQGKTSLGMIGRLKTSKSIVVRLEATDGVVPPMLREATYNTYKSQTWYSSGGSREFERVDETSPGTTYVLVPGKTNLASVNISCYLPGKSALLPLPTSTGKLTNLPAFLVEMNPYGTVHAEGPGVVIFDAAFGPGPMMDSPPRGEEDLYVPPREEWALDKVIEDLELNGKSRKEILAALEEYFRGFEYTLNLERTRRRYGEQSPLAKFLLETRKGHCEYFATATVLLLHRMGIEARYAVGYVIHERGAGERSYVVRERDAHAWAMVWDPESSIWRDFDTTPASWLDAEGATLSWRQRISDAWSRFVFEVMRVRWGQTKLRTYILWIVVPILLILLGQIIFSRRKKLNKNRGSFGMREVWPGLDSEFYELEKRLARRGYARDPGEPVSVWLQRARPTVALPDSDNSLEQLLKLHYRYRFDPEGLGPKDRESLRACAKRVIAGLEPS